MLSSFAGVVLLAGWAAAAGAGQGTGVSTQSAAGRPGSPAAGRCADSVIAPAHRQVGSAGAAPSTFALFRRARRTTDHLPTVRGLGRQLQLEMESYDPPLVRRVAAPIPQPRNAGASKLAAYVLVGAGAGDRFTVGHFPCIRTLPRDEQRKLTRSLALMRASSPVGSTFCFVVASRTLHQPGIGPAGFCDTFADAATGYGSNEITLFSDQPELASIVPDGVATVILRYRHHRPILGRVHDNIYWVAVPDYAPYAQGPPLNHPAAVRTAIVHSLATSIEWRAPDGHILRTFTLAAAQPYLRLVTGRYRACIETDCGA